MDISLNYATADIYIYTHYNAHKEQSESRNTF